MPADETFHSSGSPKSAQSNEAAHLVVRSSYQTHYEGEVSNTKFLSRIQDTVVVHSRVGIEDDEPADHENIADLTLVKKALEGFPSANVAEFLVACFFRHSEANYYFMNRVQFQERLNRLYLDGLHADSESDPSLIALALMVFAMGSQFAHLQTSNMRQTTPPTSVHKQGPGMVFYLKAKFLLPDIITQCTLEGIQVCFLTALFLLPSNSTDLSYVYHGMAMKMAIASGLHRKTSGGDLDPIDIEVRNRLWWSLYVSERRLSIILDRPETIKEEDIDTPFPDICEALDLLGGNNNLGNLQASIRLMSLFNRAVKYSNIFCLIIAVQN
ncbi:hypothetical protein N7510_005409 [Penicillium lagena]|uniref:uncharacterized protein n=1 Tax=Penicillium lagena TaxID=94218 RepID=UPI00253F837B|nr:uncharacterized protein N7510_005409 [Penicillium lagena]KAJ5612215.1 hypothetical protein N7510_005409 [Penicillium lagena]